jgi:hypothetical protein
MIYSRRGYGPSERLTAARKRALSKQPLVGGEDYSPRRICVRTEGIGTEDVGKAGTGGVFRQGPIANLSRFSHGSPTASAPRTKSAVNCISVPKTVPSAGEDDTSCPEDCQLHVCGDGNCSLGEVVATCPADCDRDPCEFGDPPCSSTATCYDGPCLESEPECFDPTHPDYLGWPDDRDLEPNGRLELVTELPCLDDEVYSNRITYDQRCPARDGYTNGFMNMLICPRSRDDPLPVPVV